MGNMNKIVNAYDLFYRSIALIEHLQNSLDSTNVSTELLLKKACATIYEYLGYDEILLFKEYGDSYNLSLWLRDNKFINRSIRLERSIFRRIYPFKYTQILEDSDAIFTLLSEKGLVTLKVPTKIFIKTFQLNERWIVILLSNSKFVDIPVYLDKMVIDTAFMLIENFLKAHEKYIFEIDTYKQERDSLAKLALSISNSRYDDTFLERIAKADINVLIEGETGTGKSTLAYRIHNLSYRKAEPFIVIDCSSIPSELFETELFGYEKGAFTGASGSKKGRLEVANGGTIFFDEIGDMPMHLQVKLLRVIQEKKFTKVGGLKEIEIDVRYIFATNKNLEDLIKEGLFRQDLYYRISVVKLTLPPLRERPLKEKKFIVEQIIKKISEKYQRLITVSDDVYNIIESYHWPGNIRELENVLEYASVMTEDGIIRIEHLPHWLITGYLKPENSAISNTVLKERNVKSTFEDIKKLEEAAIIEALLGTNFNISRAAIKLGISRRQLEYRIKKYGIIQKMQSLFKEKGL